MTEKGTLLDWLGIGGLTLSEVIRARLLGAHLGAPIDVYQGELPEDVIADYINKSAKVAEIISIAQNVVDLTQRALANRSDPRETPSEANRNVQFVAALGRLASKAKLVHVRTFLGPFLTSIWMYAQQDENWESAYSAWLRAAVTLGYEDKRAWDAVLASLGDLSNLQFVLEISAADPEYFFEPLLERIVSSNEPASGPRRISAKDLSNVLEEATYTAANAIHGRRLLRDRISRNWPILEARIGTWSRSARTRPAAQSVVRGVARSNLGALSTVKLDRAFMKGVTESRRERWDVMSRKTLDEFFITVDKRIEKALGRRPAHFGDNSITINAIPYSQSVYFLLWREIAQRARIKVIVEPCGWDEVSTKLQNREIDIAVYNQTMPKKATVLRSPIILTYHYYGLLGSTNWLRSRISHSANQDPFGETLAPYLTQPWRLRDQEIAGKSSPLFQLLQNQRIGVVENSDLEAVAKNFLQKSSTIPNVELVPCNTDEGLNSLVDGRLPFLVCGGIHQRYAKDLFSDKAFLATRLLYQTDLSFFVHRDSLTNGNLQKLMTLMHIWNATVDYWNDLLRATPQTKKGRFLRQLADFLAVEVSDTIPSGIVRNFADLREISQTHDKPLRLEIPDSGTHEAQKSFWLDVDRKVAPLAGVSEVHSNVRKLHG